jgi:hypothetical protein
LIRRTVSGLDMAALFGEVAPVSILTSPLAGLIGRASPVRPSQFGITTGEPVPLRDLRHASTLRRILFFAITHLSAHLKTHVTTVAAELAEDCHTHGSRTIAASMPAAGAQVFTATVSGAGTLETSVIWCVNGIAGGNSTLGTIAATIANSAIFTAPPVDPSPATVTVTATSTTDASKSGSAAVTITCASTTSI